MIRIFHIFLIAVGLSYSLRANALNEKNIPSLKVQPVQGHEVIVLVHGLMRTTLSMGPLKRFLEKHHYTVYLYGYPSWKYTIQEHGVYLKDYIIHLIKQDPHVKINFVTHSLGGIISREAISKLKTNQLKKMGSLIMLAPPNQGSVVAKLVNILLPPIASSIKPLIELCPDKSAYIHFVPIPKIKMGIIAGRFDAKVPPSSAYLQNTDELIVINATHSFIMMNTNAMKLILQFLEKGTFKQTDTAKNDIDKSSLGKQAKANRA